MNGAGARQLYSMRMSNSGRFLFLIILTVAVLAACSSRYRRDLYLVERRGLSKVKVEKTEFVMDGVLGDPMGRDKVVVGPGNCMILTTGSRGGSTSDAESVLIDYDRYLRYKIFLQLPSRLQPGTLPLENNSFVQLLGFYERPPEDKIYLARSGEFSVDSLSDKHLFGSIDGSFENGRQEPVTFKGEFRVKVDR